MEESRAACCANKYSADDGGVMEGWRGDKVGGSREDGRQEDVQARRGVSFQDVVGNWESVIEERRTMIKDVEESIILLK